MRSAGIGPGSTARRRKNASRTAGWPGAVIRIELGIRLVDHILDAAEEIEPVKTWRAEAVKLLQMLRRIAEELSELVEAQRLSRKGGAVASAKSPVFALSSRMPASVRTFFTCG